MAKNKNITPGQLSAINAVTIALVISVGTLIISENWILSVSVCLAVFIFSFLLIYFSVQAFIFRRIKLIYKFIYQTKANRKEEIYYKYLLPKKTIDEVQQDV